MINATVVPSNLEYQRASGGGLRSVRDLSNKPNPVPVDATVVQKVKQVPISGEPNLVVPPQDLPTVAVRPLEVKPERIGPVLAGHHGLYTLMKKEFHQWFSKIQMLEHESKEAIIKLAAEIETHL